MTDPTPNWVERLRRTVFGPPPVPRAALEERLQRRTTTPKSAAVDRALIAFDKMLDRQSAALESADAKAQLALTALLGLGILSADKLQPPADQLFVLIFVVGAISPRDS